jgi:Zn-dependent M28 family amino/carboxypeptidase
MFTRSDQYSFVKKGIPSVFLSFGYEPNSPEEKLTNAWFDQRYHQPSDDTMQPVDKQAAAKFNRYMAAVARRIAGAPNRPQWNSNSFFKRFATQ